MGNLVLTRRIKESLILTIDKNIDPNTPISEVFDKITITLADIHGAQAKILISANKAISITRSEL